MISLQTLYDLDILSADPSKECLFNQLDYCKTTGGRQYLRQLCLLEKQDVSAITDRQAAISFLAAHPNTVHLSVTENELFYIKSYLDSNYTTTERKGIKGMVSSLSSLFFQKGKYYFLLSGVRSTLALINSFKKLYISLSAAAMPALLRTALAGINDIISKLGLSPKIFESFTNDEPSPSTRFSIDNILRNKHKEDLLTMIMLYYEIEALNSLAIAHKRMKLVFSELDNEHNIEITGLRHPLVDKCITNTIVFNRDKNITLITGPNMAGKSTFMKSLGLAFFMAYLGIGVAATDARLPLLTEIRSSINVTDDINQGYSYFFAEVQEVKSIAAMLKTNKKALVIVDELFKGTNVKDAIDCSDIVMQGFLKHTDSIFIISTHLTELAEKYQNTPACRSLCFDGVLNGNHIRFSYKLLEGISSLRLGTHILKQAQIPELLGLTS